MDVQFGQNVADFRDIIKQDNKVILVYGIKTMIDRLQLVKSSRSKI